jgi:hypothetical protein
MLLQGVAEVANERESEKALHAKLATHVPAGMQSLGNR